MSPTPPPRAIGPHPDASGSAGSTWLDTAPNVQRRVLLVLTTAQGVAGIAVATAAAVGPVAVAAVCGSAALGGASTTSLVLGTAASALVIARIADRAGRRPALTLGYLTGAAGAGLAAIGNATGSRPLMLIAFLAFAPATPQASPHGSPRPTSPRPAGGPTRSAS